MSDKNTRLNEIYTVKSHHSGYMNTSFKLNTKEEILLKMTLTLEESIPLFDMTLSKMDLET